MSSARNATLTVIRLELSWTKSTYEGTMVFVRQMSQFAEGYQRAPSRCAKMTETEMARMQSIRAAGLTQPEIARLVGRNLKTVWQVTKSAVTIAI